MKKTQQILLIIGIIFFLGTSCFNNEGIGGEDKLKYGYIDKTGAYKIKPEFDKAQPFFEGFAVVRVGYKYGYIDNTGNFVIPSEFDFALTFQEGLAVIGMNEKLGFIDNSGSIVIEPRYISASSFINGLACVGIDGKWGYIDKSGAVVIEIRIEREGLTVHSIRHSCATHLLEACADIRYVQELLGHESIETTVIYTHMLHENIKITYKSHHSRENEMFVEIDDKYLKG